MREYINNTRTEFDRRFALKRLSLGKVAEIGQATSEAEVPKARKIEFHIGNPVQDPRLDQLYAQIILGNDLQKQTNRNRILSEFSLQTKDPILQTCMDLILETARKAVTYLPPGGYDPRNPDTLISQLHNWLLKGQSESLRYSTGENGERPEIAICSGGQKETLKLVLQVVEKCLLSGQKDIISLNEGVTWPIRRGYKGHIYEVYGDEEALLSQISSLLRESALPIGFLLMQQKFSAPFRRRLAALVRHHNLMMIEVNEASNAESLVLEAGMANRVLRILTPQAIDPRLKHSGIAFLLAPADFVEAVNVLHFQKKGTPSATEIKLLSFLLNENGRLDEERWLALGNNSLVEESTEDYDFDGPNDSPWVGSTIHGIAATAERLIAPVISNVQRHTETAESLFHALGRHSTIPLALIGQKKLLDPFAGMSATELVREFFANLDNSEYIEKLEQASLAVFLDLHPEYRPQWAGAISGSTRTALSVMAEAWNICEAIVSDLSWNVGDAIDKVTAAPLEEDLSFSAEKMIEVVEKRLEKDHSWPECGVVVLNRPHNATGKIASEDEIAKVLQFCLNRRIRVIDDLSYFNVIIAGPQVREKHLPIKNCRQIVDDLIAKGKLSSFAGQYLISICSISKTDCKAGARLAFYEIPDDNLRRTFERATTTIEHNRLAFLLTYLFYRQGRETIQRFWAVRDQIMWERLQALQKRIGEIPKEDNPYGIYVSAPEGAMYPHLVVEHMPANLTVDDLYIGLAERGIGLIPLTAFAKTEDSFDYARRSFRLTLGGGMSKQEIENVVPSLIAELTGQISSAAQKRCLLIPDRKGYLSEAKTNPEVEEFLSACLHNLDTYVDHLQKFASRQFNGLVPKWITDKSANRLNFLHECLPERLKMLYSKLQDQARFAACLRRELINVDVQNAVIQRFMKELSGETESERRQRFQKRLFDRTVHPTQCYSLQVEELFTKIVTGIVNPELSKLPSLQDVSRELIYEYFGMNVVISSDKEAEESIFDLNALASAEDYAFFYHNLELELLLSVWGDWDGSYRPSGQGHRLVAGALMTNVQRLYHLLTHFKEKSLLTPKEQAAVDEIGSIHREISKFKAILDKITTLTSELEACYQRHLPVIGVDGRFKKLLRRIGLARDPLHEYWKHNDRNERKMRSYRQQRSAEMRHFFEINQKLSTIVKDVVGRSEAMVRDPRILELLQAYKNPLRRYFVTPRIHQKIITAKDQFPIDTTVYNLTELNRMGAEFGYPGLVMSLQVSMTNDPGAIIALDRKLREERERVSRKNPQIVPAPIRIVLLFEETKVLENIEEFLDTIWEYAKKSRALSQPIRDRFCEIVGEFFVAGSDLSQQVGQPKALALFNEAKRRINKWLLERGLAGCLRIKFGAGESAQRQGGYYDRYAMEKVLLLDESTQIRSELQVDGITAAILRQARSPVLGILSDGNFRTFQSNLVETLRSLPVDKLAQVLYHVQQRQRQYEDEIEKVAAVYEGSRRLLQEEFFSRLDTVLQSSVSPVYRKFTNLVERNFSHIIYGKAEDMTGIHVISYFLARALPSVRDRSTVRPTKEAGEERGRRIVERLSETLPLSKHGTLLRAIGHNKAQTMLLGVNQLTTGLARALVQFMNEDDDSSADIKKYILPQLPIKEILNTLRLFHNTQLTYVKKLEKAFQPGNSALQALYEDNRELLRLVPLFQYELARRNRLLNDGMYENDAKIIKHIRPDLAVLLQKDLFNTELDELLKGNPVEVHHRTDLKRELERRTKIEEIRAEMWQFLLDPISEQIRSFTELTQAIKTLQHEGKLIVPMEESVSRARISRLGSQARERLRHVADDSMREFLTAAVHFLLYLPEKLQNIPAAVLVALRDVHKILRLEEEALSAEEQQYLHFLFLKMARISGESG